MASQSSCQKVEKYKVRLQERINVKLQYVYITLAKPSRSEECQYDELGGNDKRCRATLSKATVRVLSYVTSYITFPYNIVEH